MMELKRFKAWGGGVGGAELPPFDVQPGKMWVGGGAWWVKQAEPAYAPREEGRSS